MQRSSKKQGSSKKQVSHSLWFGFLAGAVVLALVLGWMTWMRTPQLEASEEAIKTIDALFTAINSHDEKRVSACKDQLNKHTSNGKLSPRSMIELAKCCEQANSGQWEVAARRLYRLIENQ